MLKRILILLICTSIYSSNAQQFDQLITDTINYQSNPAYVISNLSYYPNHVVSSILETKKMIFGTDIYGTYNIRVHNDQGSLVSNFSLGSSACIKWIEASDNGKVYVAGCFMDTLNLNGLDTMLVNSPSLFNVNTFLLCIEPNGTLLWKHNLTLQHSGMTTFDMLTLDPVGNCWYSYCDWQAGYIYGTNSNGQDVTSYVMNGGIRTISGLSFDPAGNLYVAGSCEDGTITIGNFSKVITDIYNMFLTRFNTSGEVNWFIDIHDITFQHPRIDADLNGNAFFSGSIFASATMGNFSLPDPQWGSGLILAKVDSIGNTLWLKGNPITPTITGAFEVGLGKHLSDDGQGGCILTGQTIGLIDWGNNVVSGQPVIGNIYTHSIVSFDQNGLPLWSLDASGSYVNPICLQLTSATSGYSTASVRGSIPYGPLQVSQPWQYTLSNVLVRFNFAPMGLSENMNEVKRGLYPNPTSGIINFSAPLEEGNLEITDLQGSRISTTRISEGTSSMKLDLTPGYYVLNYRNSTSFSQLPVIITD